MLNFENLYKNWIPAITYHTERKLVLKLMNFTKTLAVTRLPPSHTATKIHDTINLVLDQWNIPKNKIFHIVTDNGSNMVAAFKRHSLGDDSENEDNFANHNHVTLDPVDLKP